MPVNGRPPNTGFYIGAIDASVSFETNMGCAFTVKVSDLRFNLGLADPGSNPAASAFLPSDFTAMQGCHLTLSGPDWKIESEESIPIHHNIGPLDVQTLLIHADTGSFSVGVNASLSIGAITAQAQGLGFRIDFPSQSPSLDVSVFLKGLGLRADFGGIKLAAMFGSTNTTPPDYIGAASLSVFDTFSLSAIGGYRTSSDSTSTFVFANLSAPLGGAPFCFVTGIAAGFGLNRNLPPLTDLQDHPFMQIMRGDIPLDPGADLQSRLTALDCAFRYSKGAFWIAAGVEFTSFAFINGRMLVAVKTDPFILEILGSVGFGIEEIAQFELDFALSVDIEKLFVTAQISRNSYLIHPGLFGLSGQFAFEVWYSGDHAGDFVLSVGGYHPCFPVPPHYPNVERVEVHAVVFDIIHFSVSCFFALTPHAIMAGAAVSLYGDFWIEAGLDVYVDVYVQWDPFFLIATMGVSVWFEIFGGRHEIGVDLRIHTPVFGGTAAISLFIASFTIDFGGAPWSPPLSFSDFLGNHLRLPTEVSGNAVTVIPFSTKGRAGLWRVDVGFGGVATYPDSEADAAQVGVDPKSPIQVGAEFGLVIRTRVPIFDIALPSDTDTVGVSGHLHLPLCRHVDISNCLTARIARAKAPNQKWSARNYPAAQFGGEPTNPSAESDSLNRASMVAAAANTLPTVMGVDTLTLDYAAKPDPPETLTTEYWKCDLASEYSKRLDDYPLPLGNVTSPKCAASSLGRGLAGWKGIDVMSAPRRLARVPIIIPQPDFPVAEAAVAPALMQRDHIVMRPASAGLRLATGIQTVAVPISPLRRAELADVVLHVVDPPATRQDMAKLRGLAVGRVVQRAHAAVRPAQQRREKIGGALAIQSGRALVVELSRLKAAQGKLRIDVAPGQVLRAIFLGGYGRATGDAELRMSASLDVPARTRRVAFIVETPDQPVFGPNPDRPQEPMGIQSDTRVVALEGHTFAAHGSVLRVASGFPVYVPQLASIPGLEVLRWARSMSLRFAAPLAGTIVLVVNAVKRDPAPAIEQLRWRGDDAALGQLRIVAGGESTALLLPVAAPGAWSFELDIGRDYRLESAVALGEDTETVTAALSRSSRWSFLDYVWTPSDQTLPTGTPTAPAALVHLELA
jgi:hypothetical protein